MLLDLALREEEEDCWLWGCLPLGQGDGVCVPRCQYSSARSINQRWDWGSEMLYDSTQRFYALCCELLCRLLSGGLPIYTVQWPDMGRLAISWAG